MLQQCTVEQLNYGRKVWDFMQWARCAFGISLILVISSITLMSLKGFNWGLDFTGGTVIEISLAHSVDTNKIRASLQKADCKGLVLQNFGSSREIMVRIPSVYDANRGQEIHDNLIQVIKETTKQKVTVKRIDFVGPSVGKDLIQKGGMALLMALISILVYFAFRFEWRLGVSLVIALAHDVVITAGVLSLCEIEIDQTIIASLMSVIGYSLNDSIVVSDRIRENFRRIRHGTPYQIFNISLTQILHRTLITSGITLIVILMLYIFGGPVLEGFSLTMLIGIFVGTVSSIYVASSLALNFGINRSHFPSRKRQNKR